MARLPGWLSFLRPLVAKGRISALKALGLYELRNLVGTRGGISSATDLLVIRLSDRISTIESQVNWRLYGLPSRVCNVKLEQAQLLSGSGDVEDALVRLNQLCDKAFESIPSSIFPENGCDNIFVFEGLSAEMTAFSKLFTNANRATIIEDDSELFHAIRKPSEKFIAHTHAHIDRLMVPAQSALARLGEPEFDFIWFSSVFERLTPIQIQIAFSRAQLALKPNACCAGFFVDYMLTDQGAYWLDPRRLRPLSRQFLSATAAQAGLKIEFIPTSRADTFYFKCKK